MREVESDPKAPPSSLETTLPEESGHTGPARGATFGHFEITGQLGGGGMGVVFAARDTLLDRTVALKLIRPDRGGARARTRLLREAQVLARFKHPNVVTVFEAGSSGDEIFIAMELVAGGTVQEWMRTPRPWREVVRLFIDIGRGLAAAHAMGLVHRDIKPSNVFLDAAGAPKIGDFGLVSEEGTSSDDSQNDSDSDERAVRAVSITTTGRVLGTPAYMSPEQMAGQRADARADQYAFCVSLHQVLTGELPDQPERGRPVPPRLRRILSRGLEARVTARYPSMDALLVDLRGALQERARQRIAIGGAIAVAIGVGVLARATLIDPCPPPTAKLDAIWGRARRATIRDHVLAVDHDQGATRMATASGAIDPFIRALSAMQVDACHATRVRGAQSDTMFDLRMQCLAHRYTELEESVTILADAPNVAALDRAVIGLVKLPPIAMCGDTVALAKFAPPPRDPVVRAASERILDKVGQITARTRGGSLDGLPAQARALVAEARTLGDATTLAAALNALAEIELSINDPTNAEVTLRELTQVAARAHDDRIEAFAWTELVAARDGKTEQSLALVPAASAAVLRAGEPDEQQSDRLRAQAMVLDESPHPADALAKLEEARALLEKAGAASTGSPLASRLSDVYFSRGNAKDHADDNPGAIADYRRAIALYQTIYGPDSPDEAFAWNNLGEVYRHDRKLDDALAAFRNAVRIREPRLGDSPGLGGSLVGLATVLADQGHWRESFETNDRAVRMFRRLFPASDTQQLTAMIARARALVHLDQPDAGAAAYQEILALMKQNGIHTFNLAITEFNLAELNSRRGRCAEASAGFAEALTAFEAMRGPNASVLAHPLVGQARCLLILRRPAEALVPLERLHLLGAEGGTEAVNARGRFYLDRALIESGKDRARGWADVQAARDALVSAGTEPDELREIDRWLAAAHAPKPQKSAGAR